jgi:probable rRNA maturation factor
MFTLQNRILADYREAKESATRAAAQRSNDDRVLGVVGLAEEEDKPAPDADAG